MKRKKIKTLAHVITVLYIPGSTITYGRRWFCHRYCFTAGIGVNTSCGKMSKPNEVNVSATICGLSVE